MPALSSTMTEGKIVQWCKSVGDEVQEGDVLMVVESDKADMDVEAYEAGYVADIRIPEGESATVGGTVAVLVASADQVAVYQQQSAAPAAPPATLAAPAAPAAPAAGTPITMPALSSTMTEGKIVQWLKQPGERVESGDAIMVVESDKADMDVEAFDDGYLAVVNTQEGESAAVGAVVAVLAASEAEVEAIAAGAGATGASATAAPASSSPSAAAPADGAASGAGGVAAAGRVVASGQAKKIAQEAALDLASVAGSGPGGRIVAADVLRAADGQPAPAHIPAQGVIAATPMARVLAKKSSVDLSQINGTGSFGRVTEDDVLVFLGKPPKKSAATPSVAPAPAAAAPPPASAPAAPPTPSGVVPMTGMQRGVAANMEATLGVPIFRVSRTIVTDAFDDLYVRLKPKGVSVSVMLAKAVAMCLAKHPLINAAYDAAGAIKYHDTVDVGMAVAIEGGLLTPTLKDAGNKDIYTLGREWRELVGKAKTKSLSRDESTGTFYISNLGMMGVSQFDAILPPNAGSILAIAASTPIVVQQPNGYLGTVKQMTVTITCDHRHIYGADAALFLKDLAQLLESGVDSLVFD